MSDDLKAMDALLVEVRRKRYQREKNARCPTISGKRMPTREEAGRITVCVLDNWNPDDAEYMTHARDWAWMLVMKGWVEPYFMSFGFGSFALSTYDVLHDFSKEFE